MIPLLVACGGALGASMRFLLGHLLDERLPLGTLLANVTGSFLLGLLAASSLSGEAWALLGTGFCGAFTTYSALAVKSVELGRATGTAYALGTVVLAVGAACLGASLA